MPDLKHFTPIGKTNWRNQGQLFGILPADRLHHVFLAGATGMGKSQLLVNMSLDDIRKGHGVCVIDPHGDAIEAIVRELPRHRLDDVVHFDATNRAKLPAFNPLFGVPEHQRQLVASEMIATFSKLFSDAWGSKMERGLRMAILTLLQYPHGTLLDINRLLTDGDFRRAVLRHTSDPYILGFWEKEYGLYSSAAQSSAILPILNKVGVLLESDILRGIFGQQQSISIEECMNGNKIVLCNLAKGMIGEDVAAVLGSFVISAIQSATLRRATIAIDQRKAFYLYVDESPTFVSASFAAMLPQVRKFGLGLFLACQYLGQWEPRTLDAILGNVGTLICFRLGLSDAKVMEREFHPVFAFDDFIGLPKYHIYTRLMIGGMTSKGFSAITLQNQCNI